MDYTTPPFAKIRRADRALDEADIKALLHRAPFGTLATVYEGQPFVIGNLFVYDEAAHAIYLHTAKQGRARFNVERDPRVCFSVSEMGRLLPAAEALEFSVEYAGATVFGRAEIVADPDAARRALQALLDKYFPHLRSGKHYRAITDAELARTSVFRIAIAEWSGKRKQGAADFPGAFLYGQAPGETP